MDTREWLLRWAPFKLDALGLVTLLGADEINRALGRLCASHLTEFLPLVAGHVIASDSIRQHISGFTVFNITDGICCTDVAGWFSRWLLCQQITYNATTLTIGTMLPSPAPRELGKGRFWRAAALGIIVSLSMTILALIISDWWGSANAIALVVGTTARWRVLEANREALNRNTERGIKQSSAVVKTLWQLPDGSWLIVYLPRGILTECLLTTPEPQNPRMYSIFRYVAWVAFLVHVVSLGMAALPCQLLCVGVLAVSTVCAVKRVGSHDPIVGSRLVIRRMDRREGGSSMAALFASLMLSQEEEESMMDWRIMPMPRNRVWWKKYKDCVAKNSICAFSDWKRQETWESYETPPSVSTKV